MAIPPGEIAGSNRLLLQKEFEPFGKYLERVQIYSSDSWNIFTNIFRSDFFVGVTSNLKIQQKKTDK